MRPGLEELTERAIVLAEQTAATQSEIVRQQLADTQTVARLRKITIGLGVSLAVDIALTLVVLLQAGHQAELTHAIHQSQLAACAIGNEFRVSETQVWNHFIATSTAPPGETPAQRAVRLARIADARTYIAGHYRPVDCTALYGK